MCKTYNNHKHTHSACLSYNLGKVGGQDSVWWHISPSICVMLNPLSWLTLRSHRMQNWTWVYCSPPEEAGHSVRARHSRAQGVPTVIFVCRSADRIQTPDDEECMYVPRENLWRKIITISLPTPTKSIIGSLGNREFVLLFFFLFFLYTCYVVRVSCDRRCSSRRPTPVHSFALKLSSKEPSKHTLNIRTGYRSLPTVMKL